MLQMKCPQCEGKINSPFLVEIQSVTCNQCERNVPVTDVFVTTQHFTMHRDTLLKRVRHYRSILKEVEQEKLLLQNNKHETSSQIVTLNQYYAALQELLEAARENYRLKISDELPLDIGCEGVVSQGRLLNISTKGAAINSNNISGFQQKDTNLKLLFSLPDITVPLSLTAKVAWSSKPSKDEKHDNITLGVYFSEIKDKFHSYIWDYILKTYNCSYA